jgi:dihydrofolate reductase
MGRKTYDSIGKPLPNRSNLVLSANIKFIEGCEVFSDIPAAIAYAEEKGFLHLFVIGGDSIYKQDLDYCQTVYLTRIQHTFEADAFFVKLNTNEWSLRSSEEHPKDEKNAYPHTFEVWQRN